MLKTSFLLLTAALMSLACSAQRITADKVPADVLKSFNARFPDAENVRWEKQEQNDFEANFKSGDAPESSTFDSSGKWKETEVEISPSDLPAVVQQKLNRQFASFKTIEAARIEDIKHGSCYEVELQKGKEKYDVLLSSGGSVLSKEEDKDDEDDKD